MTQRNDIAATALIASLGYAMPVSHGQFPKRKKAPSSWAVITAQIRNEDKKAKKRAKISAARKQNVRRQS